MAAQLGRLNLKIAWEHRTRQCNHHVVALNEILGTTDDVVDFALFAGGDLAAAQAVGVWMLFELEHLADDDVVELRWAEFLDLFDIEAE